ncbi:MAG: multiprotein bridging factor aMBF1 [archaeon]
MECEICGKESFNLKKVMVDESSLLACEKCVVFDKNKEEKSFSSSQEPEEYFKPVPKRSFSPKVFISRPQKFTKPRFQQKDITLIDDYGIVVRKARERKNLTLKDLGVKLFVKESELKLLELGKLFPSNDLVRKLENFFNFKLTDDSEKEEVKFSSNQTSRLTLSDLLDKKLKEKEEQ